MSTLALCSIVEEEEGTTEEVVEGAGGVVEELIITGPQVEAKSFLREEEGITVATVTPPGVKKGQL